MPKKPSDEIKQEIVRCLNTKTDREVAKQFGVAPSTVCKLRQKAGLIRQQSVKFIIKNLSKTQRAALGKLSDNDMAKVLGCSAELVRLVRAKLGIKPDPTRWNPPFNWTPESDALLGTNYDQVIAAKLGATPYQVFARRKKLGIKSYNETKPMANRTRLKDEKAIVMHCEACNNVEYEATPNIIAVRITQADLAKYERAIAALTEIGADKCTYWYDGDYELYVVGDEVTEDTEGCVHLSSDYYEGYYILEEFDNEFVRINGSEISVYKDGDLQIRLDIKHSNEEIWADIGKVEELKEQLGVNESTAPTNYLYEHWFCANFGVLSNLENDGYDNETVLLQEARSMLKTLVNSEAQLIIEWVGVDSVEDDE